MVEHRTVKQKAAHQQNPFSRVEAINYLTTYVRASYFVEHKPFRRSLHRLSARSIYQSEVPKLSNDLYTGQGVVLSTVGLFRRSPPTALAKSI